MKKILFVLDDEKRNFTYARVSGVRRAIRNAADPINLYVFRSAGFSGFEARHNQGEYNIYRLPDFRDFDGIILDLNSAKSHLANYYASKGEEYVVQAARQSGRPVVSIANRIPGFYYVGIDNRTAMTSLIAYLHEQLGLSAFWFIMGPPDNYENTVRTQALRDYCAQKDLNAGEDQFFFESYQMESGVTGFWTLLEAHGGRLPQAVVCANDLLARGVCQAAAQGGYRVPEDFCVTGFDNLDYSAYLTPFITTVDQYQWEVGGCCVNVLRRLWQGLPVQEVTHTPTRLMLRESTGGTPASEGGSSQRIREYVRNEMARAAFQDRFYALQCRLPGCNTLEEICLALESCLPSMSCQGLALLLDPKFHDLTGQVDYDRETGRFRPGVSTLCTEGYPERLELFYTWEADKGSSFPRRLLKGLFPTFDPARGGQDYLFLPLHFMEETVGCLVIRDCAETLHTGSVSLMVNSLTMSLRSFFAGKRLDNLNRLLSGISMRDEMTGLCNRLGYRQLAPMLLERTRAGGKRLGVLSVDMDGLKRINDTLGHAWGDRAIRCVAAAIGRTAPPEAVTIRLGGDEFLILTPAAEEQELLALTEALRAALAREGEAQFPSDPPGVSVGCLLADPADGRRLEDYVEEADQLMYLDKRSRKADRAL